MTCQTRATFIGVACLVALCSALPTKADASSAMRLVEVTADAGIDFVHVDGRSGRRYFLETVGSGTGFFDADGDGLVDLYLVNGAALPGAVVDIAPTNRLYRNHGDGTFADVTERAGVGDTGYGAGCAAADHDNDGDLDLYITNFGPNVLYRNDGDGTFTDVTREAGVGDGQWSLSCAFADYDNDGDVDLYVTNYIDFSFDEHKTCTHRQFDVYCSPELFRGAPDTLYRNRGDGTFDDVTRPAGVFDGTAKGMGVVFGDYDDDGFTDCYVANDVGANHLYRNRGDGTFENVAWMAGVEGDENGYTQGTMGVDFGDIDRDGRLDLVGLNYQKQPNALYRNEGGGFFEDLSLRAGLGYSLPLVGWGTDFLDLDNDGDLDILVANGHLQDRVEEYDPTTSYAQLNQVLLNDGTGRYTVANDLGPGLYTRKSSRGLASADIDNDGDLDVLVTNAADAPDLLLNEGANRRSWLRVRLIGVRVNRAGIGARVTVRAGDTIQVDEARAGSGYLSQNDLTLHFGLGSMTRVDSVEVRWPGGHVDEYLDLPTDRTVTITEGAADVDAGER